MGLLEYCMTFGANSCQLCVLNVSGKTLFNRTPSQQINDSRLSKSTQSAYVGVATTTLPRSHLAPHLDTVQQLHAHVWAALSMCFFCMRQHSTLVRHCGTVSTSTLGCSNQHAVQPCKDQKHRTQLSCKGKHYSTQGSQAITQPSAS